MEGWRTLEAGKDSAGVEGIDRNIVLAVEVEFFLDTPYCSNECCFSSIILNSHGTINCSTAIISTSIERDYREQMLMIHPSCRARILGIILCIRYIGYHQQVPQMTRYSFKVDIDNLPELIKRHQMERSSFICPRIIYQNINFPQL